MAALVAVLAPVTEDRRRRFFLCVKVSSYTSFRRGINA